jgi:dihydroorotate dehydrogenase electron transfer subunit
MIERNIKIIFNTRVTSDTYIMGLDSSEIVTGSRPGQFVMVRVESHLDPLLRRPFSICGVRDNNLFYILYRVVGRGTAILSQKREGENLSILGPLGKGFDLKKTEGKAVLVSGGIGIAPLIFLAQVMKGRDMEFMAGFSSSAEIIDPGNIGFSANNISLATDDGTKGYAGTVTDLLEKFLKKQSGQITTFSLYSCGPSPMLKRIASIAIDYNITCQVSMETAMACGLGACQGCAVKASSFEDAPLYYRVCKEGPVFGSDRIDWSCI